MAHGGRRVGAGRKPKPRDVPATAGARVLPHPSSPATSPPPVGPESPPADVPPPAGLSADALEVWKEQAPHAVANRTLTPAQARSFALYCELVVIERNERGGSGRAGSNHRGLIKELNTRELQFGLTANGKPVIPAKPAPARDDDEAFFGGPRGIVAG